MSEYQPIIRGLSGNPVMINGEAAQIDGKGTLIGINGKPLIRDGRGIPVQVGDQTVRYTNNSITSEEIGGLPVTLNLTGEPSAVEGLIGITRRPLEDLREITQVVKPNSSVADTQPTPLTDRHTYPDNNAWWKANISGEFKIGETSVSSTPVIQFKEVPLPPQPMIIVDRLPRSGHAGDRNRYI